MPKKLTLQQVDDRLSQRHIKRIDEYINNHTQINFLCLIDGCEHIWKTKPANIFHGQGCPKCYGNVKLTNKDVDNKIDGRNILRLGNYVGNKIPIDFQCQICLYIWAAEPASIFNQGSGCPKCAGKVKINNGDMDNRLINRNIVRLDSVVNGSVPINWACQICDYVWKTRPDTIIQGHGCPNCAECRQITNEDVDQKLLNRKIKRVEDIINTKTPITFQCEECNLSWKTTPSKILHQETGCPKCSHTVSKSEISWLDSLGIPQVYRQAKFKIDGKLIKPDAFDPNTKTIYEFYGDFWHGNPKKFPAHKTNIATKKTFGEMYQKTIEREEFLVRHGYKVVSIWEDDFNALVA